MANIRIISGTYGFRENGMIHPKFEEKIQKVLSVPFVFPDDIIDRLKEDRTV